MKKSLPKKQTKTEQNKQTQEINSLKQQLLRVSADFDNYRKRTQTEQSNTISNSKAEMILLLLPVLNNLSLALKHVPENIDSNWLEGIKHIQRQLEETFAIEGFRLINDKNEKFDPARHEAISYEESDLAPDSIIEVIDIGLENQDKVIKPARVRVARGKTN